MTANRAPSLWPITFGLCAVALVMAWAVHSMDDSAPIQQALGTREEPQLVNVSVDAVLSLPTATVTPIPTLEPTPRTERVTINECTMTPEPGRTCEWPNPTPLPPTPFPLCGPEMKGGYTCTWATVTP